VSDSDRELRDRLEQAQSELRRAVVRLDELENVATDRAILKQQLDAATTELKAANERLAELEAQSVETLQAELDEIRRERDLLKQRLEQADKMREQWDQKVTQRESELAVARAEEWRLREELAGRPEPPKKPRTPRWLFALPLAYAVGATVLWLRTCG